MRLETPHIPLRISANEAELTLRNFAPTEQLVSEADGTIAFACGGVSIKAYVTEGKVSSVWYNDPAGRGSETGLQHKITACLARYGDPASWECRLDNGWMRYWYNVPPRVAMVYGIQSDVVRFNLWHP
jgi:hypothetical protein